MIAVFSTMQLIDLFSLQRRDMSIGCQCIQFLRSSFESRLPALGLSRFIGMYRGFIGAERNGSYDNATRNLG